MCHAVGAREAFEKIRSSVATAPKPEIEDAPEWLHSVERMQEFFNATAPVWDSVFGSEQPDPLYRVVAAQIEATDAPVKILILGCGTGLELPNIFAKAPNAQITGIDIAPNMLTELRRKFSGQSAQIELIEGSYLDAPLGQQQFDYAVATLTTHHLPPDSKLALYRRIRNALKPKGSYIEGDQSTDQQREQEILVVYCKLMRIYAGSAISWDDMQ